MDVVKVEEGIFIPNLGLAAAAFAAFLCILTMSQPTELAIKAVIDFSLGIPLTIACLFLTGIKKPDWLYLIIIWLNSVFLVFGSLLCLLGLHKCFNLVSEKAANNFAVIAIFIFLMNTILGIHQIIKFYTKERKKH